MGFCTPPRAKTRKDTQPVSSLMGCASRLTTRAVRHYRSEDLGLRKFFTSRSPDPDSLLAVLKSLKSTGGPTPRTALAQATGMPARRITGLVNQLEEAGAVTAGKRGVRLTSEKKLPALVRAAVERSEARQNVEHSRLAMMRAYAETDSCRRQFLLGYFGENLPRPCGNCDNCIEAAAKAGTKETNLHDDGRPGVAAAVTGAVDLATAEAFPLQSTVVHKEWGPGLVMRHEDDIITVLFEQEGYKTLSRSAVTQHELLKPA